MKRLTLLWTLALLPVAACHESGSPTAPDQRLPTSSLPRLELSLLQSSIWVEQFGTSAFDMAEGIAADAGGVYVAGTTEGSLGGANAGGSDGFLRKYDPDLGALWTVQFGTAGDDEAHAVAAHASGVYVVGEAGGDAFIHKYDAGGGLVWSDAFGTAAFDAAGDVSVTDDGVHVTGFTGGDLGGTVGGFDAFVRKYDFDGNIAWTRQFGTSTTDVGSGVAADAGGVYVTGTTQGELGGPNAGQDDVFLRKYDASGNVLWTTQFGSTTFDFAESVAVGASGVYVAGETFGSIDGANVGDLDAFVRRYDTDGTLAWGRQFGTAFADLAAGVATDGTGAYLAGATFGDLDLANAGIGDAFIRKYDPNGDVVLANQFGSEEVDEGTAAVAIGAAGVFVAGWTEGVLGASSAGGRDAWVTQVAEGQPEGTLADLEDAVNDLLADGTLSHGQARSLTAKLQAAQAHLDAGNTKAAIQLLQVFMGDVANMIDSGKLEPAVGQALLDAASALLAGLGA